MQQVTVDSKCRVWYGRKNIGLVRLLENGYWGLAPRLIDGYWPSDLMHAIANKMDEMNMTWSDTLETYDGT